MFRNVPKNIFHNVWKCAEKTISKVIWAGKGALDAILSQDKKKIGDRFHFQWYRRRLNYQFSNYVTDKINGSRVQPSLLGEGQRPDPGDGGNRAYFVICSAILTSLLTLQLISPWNSYFWRVWWACARTSRKLCETTISSPEPSNLSRNESLGRVVRSGVKITQG